MKVHSPHLPSWLAALLALACVLIPARAEAFCGFYVSGADAELYNNATMVVLMRAGKRTVLSMQNDYQGPPENFAMVVPVPVVLQEDNVKTLDKEVFKRVDSLAAPRLVEYWEQDPCAVREEKKEGGFGMRPRAAAAAEKADAADDLGVRIEAQFTVGEYEIVILGADDSAGLDTWLKREGYNIPEGAEPLLRPYVEEGMKFFVAKVDAQKVKLEDGRAKLSPLRFHYDDDKFRLPVRLGLMNAKDKQDLIVHILARGQRYDVANFEAVTIPTNIDVDDDVKDRFGEFYAALFDATLAKNPKAVITEYSWDSSTCDPCPVPALQHQELMTLGADVLPADDDVDDIRERRFRPSRGFVLTRLHARYDKSSLGEDLVFRKADPIVGGREFRQSVDGKQQLERGSTPAQVNNFQGRYAIRHRWKKGISCSDPVFGVWGGPPGGEPPSRPFAALDLAFAKRDGVKLAEVVRSPVPELDLQPPPKKPKEKPKDKSAVDDAKSSDCSCRSAPQPMSPRACWLASLLGLALWLRRRRA